jgi:hypothetical protein
MAESSPSSSNSKPAAAEEEEEAAANDLLATQEILQGLKDALSRRAAAHQDKISLTPTTRDELLQESFPMIPPTSSSNGEDGDNVKADLTTEECIALRIGLQSVIHSDVKRKMSLLQEQLSEYHAILEDVIAYKSKCEQLEQDKQDLTRICHDTCKERDDKIELLEREVCRLRRLNEGQRLQLLFNSSRNGSTSHEERGSAQGGQPGLSQASYYGQEYQLYPGFNPQYYSYPPPPLRPSPRAQSGMLTMMSNSNHSAYHPQPCTTMEPSQRRSLTSAVAAAGAVATTNSHDNNNNNSSMAMDPSCIMATPTTNFTSTSTSSYGFDIGAIQPLPFHNRRLLPSSSHHDDDDSSRCNKKSRLS